MRSAKTKLRARFRGRQIQLRGAGNPNRLVRLSLTWEEYKRAAATFRPSAEELTRFRDLRPRSQARHFSARGCFFSASSPNFRKLIFALFVVSRPVFLLPLFGFQQSLYGLGGSLSTPSLVVVHRGPRRFASPSSQAIDEDQPFAAPFRSFRGFIRSVASARVALARRGIWKREVPASG